MLKSILARPPGVPLPRILLLVALAVVVGVFFAFFWNLVWTTDPFFGGLFAPLSGNAALALAPVLGFATLAGALRVLMPCGMPVLFTTLPLLQSSESKGRILALTGAFTLGTVAVLAVFGAIVGGLGGVFYWLVGPDHTRQVFTTVAYTSVGVFSLAYGLSQLGLLRLPAITNPLRRAVPGNPSESPSAMWHAFGLGAFVGGGLGAACPLATSVAVVAWVGATGDPVLGALVETAFALGIVLPVFTLSILTRYGALPEVGAALWGRRRLINNVGGLAMVALGVSLVVLWSMLR